MCRLADASGPGRADFSAEPDRLVLLRLHLLAGTEPGGLDHAVAAVRLWGNMTGELFEEAAAEAAVEMRAAKTRLEEEVSGGGRETSRG